MGTIVTIPTGIANRRGSDGSGFAIGKQTATGSPLDRVNFASEAGTDAIGTGFDAADPVSYYSEGDGTITIATSGNVTADAEFEVVGRSAAGAVLTETITVASGAAAQAGTENFAGIYITTITPPTAILAALTWGVSVSTRALTVSNGMIPILFPVSNLDMNEDANISESDLISALGAATPSEIGQFSGHANFTTGVLTENLPYLLAGQFNPQGGLTSTAVGIQSAGAAIAVPANGDVVIVLPTGGTTHPSKIKITFAAAPASGTLLVEGYTKIGSKQNNRRFRPEPITLGAARTYETENYYVWDADNPLTITASSVGTTGNAAFVLDPELFDTLFSIARNDQQFQGWSMQGLVGGEPRAGFDVVPSQMTITAAPGGVSFEMQCPAGQVSRNRTIQGGEIEQLLLDANYEGASSERYAGWSIAFRYGTDLVKVTNLVIGFNRNYAADDAADGDRFATDIEATADRAITITPTTRFRSSYEANAVFARWQDIFREDRRTPLEARMYNYTGQGQRRQIIISGPSSQLRESPQTVVGGPGSIDEALSFQAYPSGTATEIEIRLFTTQRYTV